MGIFESFRLSVAATPSTSLDRLYQRARRCLRHFGGVGLWKLSEKRISLFLVSLLFLDKVPYFILFGYFSFFSSFLFLSSSRWIMAVWFYFHVLYKELLRSLCIVVLNSPFFLSSFLYNFFLNILCLHCFCTFLSYVFYLVYLEANKRNLHLLRPRLLIKDQP